MPLSLFRRIDPRFDAKMEILEFASLRTRIANRHAPADQNAFAIDSPIARVVRGAFFQPVKSLPLNSCTQPSLSATRNGGRIDHRPHAVGRPLKEMAASRQSPMPRGATRAAAATHFRLPDSPAADLRGECGCNPSAWRWP